MNITKCIFDIKYTNMESALNCVDDKLKTEQ